MTGACNLELTYASATRSSLTLSASWMQNVRTAVLAVSACCAAWYAAQQNCSIERLTRPKRRRNDTQGRALSVSEKRGKEKDNLIDQSSHEGGFETFVPNELLVTFVSSQK